MFCGLRINLIQISAGGFASGGKADIAGSPSWAKNKTHALQQAGLFDHLVGSQQYGGGHRSNVDGSASGAPQDVAGTTARDPVPAKSCPSYRQR
jgi:hypothetical protein